jgi:uncharacterized membrane protein
MKLVFDPAWPWSSRGVGPASFFLVAGILVALTVWTYRGIPGARPRRVLALICLRLAALCLAFIAVFRPSFASPDDWRTPSVLIVAADTSESMTIHDEHGSQSRWEYMNRVLQEAEPQLRALRNDHNVSVLLYGFDGAVHEFQPDGTADGKRTDFGEMLHSLYDRHGGERYLRGLLILSDGADNGARYAAAPLAAKWRALSCPVHTFAFGQTTTSSDQRDIAFTGINPDPSPLAIKGKLTVKGTVDAPGFENAVVQVHLFLNDKPVAVKDSTLAKTTGNQIQVECDAPETPGEIKVTLKIDPKAGEVSQLNNEISTYVTVTKEGISVLYVEGKYRAWEPKFIRYALSNDPNIRLFEAVRLSDEPPPPGQADLFRLDTQHYDVIILGDITAKKFTAGNPKILNTLYDLVTEKGTGLMMLGGRDSFGNSDWENTPLEKLLPVTLDVSGQDDRPTQMTPTFEGLRHYIMRLSNDEAGNEAVWKRLTRLDGVTKLGQPKPAAAVLAQSQFGAPLLVGQLHTGNGRTLAFGGDTTWRWRRSEEGIKAHTRFWEQIVLWLAKRDESDGNVLVMPDSRRLPAGGKLGFTVKLRGKGGVEIGPKDSHFEVKVIGPSKAETTVPTGPEQGEERGNYWKTDVPGEYIIVARGWGKDTDGKPLENLAESRVRFIVYQDDAEMARQAADHEFLDKLAFAGGGKMHAPEELKQVLTDIAATPVVQGKAKSRLWPDWRRAPGSGSGGDQLRALTGSGILACYLLFVAILCTEWGLRRYWGLV